MCHAAAGDIIDALLPHVCCAQYDRSVELVTMLGVSGTLLLTPVLMGWVQLLQGTGLLEFTLQGAGGSGGGGGGSG